MTERDSEVLTLETHVVSARPSLMRLLRWPISRKLVYLGGDLAALVVAHMAAVRLIHHLLHIPLASMNPAEYHRYYIPFFAVVLLLFDGYKTPELRRPERELELGCKAVALTFLGLMPFNFLVFKSQPFSRYLLVCWFVVAGVLLLIVRFALRGLNIRLWKTGVGRRRTVLLGPAAGLAGYSRLLSTQRHHAYELLGWIPGSSEAAALPASSLRLPVLGSLEQWEEVVQQAGADLLVVASSACPDGDDLLGRILHRCKGLGLDVELYSSVLAASDLNYEMDEFSGCFRLFARPQWALALQRFVKRVLDLAIGLVGSLVTVVLVPIIGLLIKLDDGGPIFYRSAYLGQDGRNRYYLKFRTMRADADQVLETDENLRCEFRARHKLMNDPRVTRVGRFLRKSSLDEFPQFFSVIKKDLTFVGPRTIRQDEAAHYGPLLGKLLSVRPGLTGFWQAMGRQTTTYEERVRMDMFYIDHWSIWLDLWIVAKTFWKVLRAEGAY